MQFGEPICGDICEEQSHLGYPQQFPGLPLSIVSFVVTFSTGGFLFSLLTMLFYFYMHMTPRSVWACSTAFTAYGDTQVETRLGGAEKGAVRVGGQQRKPSLFLNGDLSLYCTWLQLQENS